MDGTTSHRILPKLDSWLRSPEGAQNRWLNRPSMAAAWLGLSLAIITPPHGTGFTVCWFNNCTGLPCPGCGLTRSMSCALHGMFLESWNYHPMGLLILALLIAIALASLLPPLLKKRLARYVESHAQIFNSAYLTFVCAFMIFGMSRIFADLRSAVAALSL